MEDGASLFVKVLNYGNAGMPLFIAHHGAPGASNHAESETSYACLQDNTGFRVLLFDARGSGASDKIGPFTRDRWVADLECLR